MDWGLVRGESSWRVIEWIRVVMCLGISWREVDGIRIPGREIQGSRSGTADGRLVVLMSCMDLAVEEDVKEDVYTSRVRHWEALFDSENCYVSSRNVLI